MVLMAAFSVACASEDPLPFATSPSLRPPANAIVRNLDTGRARLEVSGDLRGIYNWDLRGATDTADVTVVTWGENGLSFNLLAGPGAIIPGEHPTSLDLWIDLFLGTTARGFNSEQGECTLDIQDADQRLTGTVSCPALTSQDGRTTIEMTGTFTAKPRSP
jgi:hypothetical protein